MKMLIRAHKTAFLKQLIQFITLAFLLTVNTVFAVEISPESIEGTTKVDAEGFIELADETPSLTIIDSRIPGDRKQGYIEGSSSLPDVNTNCDSLAKLIKKKSTPSLFYCNGIKCGRSAKAIEIALSCGYHNIFWFRGGFEEWLEKGYPYLQE